MSKDVIPQLNLHASWAANPEDMTQPMGPLDEGDQALVDAVNGLPAIIHEGEYEGSSIKTFKDHQPGGDMVSVESATPDVREKIEIRIRKNPRTGYVDVGVPDISAEVSQISPDRNEVMSVTRASGNMITPDSVDGGPMRKNRAAAQLFKLEVARKIEIASENLDSAIVVPAGKSK